MTTHDPDLVNLICWLRASATTEELLDAVRAWDDAQIVNRVQHATPLGVLKHPSSESARCAYCRSPTPEGGP